MGKKRKKKNGMVLKEPEAKANLCYKDTVFRMLFRDREQLLGLYNAVSGRHYKKPEQLEIVTLENAVYMGMKNDLAFLIDFNLYLFEHQSTVNINMPLRFLQYVSAEYSRLTVSENLYGGSRIQIPSPHFVVFYNGVESYDERRELRLSDAFQNREEDPELELRVQVLNINEGFNESLKEQCRTLREYMQYVDKVRAYAGNVSIDRAVEQAVDECIGQNILREFLLKNKAEVKRMSIFEYNEEETRRAIRESAHEQGWSSGKAMGKAEDVLLLLKRKGTVPSVLEKEILEEKNAEVLQEWLIAAAEVKSIDEFIRRKQSMNERK